jgi:acetyl-CoA carboxylase carboxyltransferase component
LMHTKGVLIMTLNGSMVLTGKKALDYSGGVSAEDERGIGGAERIMGPNGQAQFIANDLGDAYRILFEWYRFSYVHHDETKPRKIKTTDPIERNILDVSSIHQHSEAIQDIFDNKINAERKKSFRIRTVMDNVIDQDHRYLERYAGLQDGETAVVWDSHIGGWPVCLIGVESRQIPRQGRIPMDGPETWSGGTLFPNSSKKVARSINSASGNRPLVVLANLSGFDGSPESLRRLQLEYGAEIGRSVVNFQGPIIFIVIGRYHGGAYVVFSKSLNANLQAFAVNGSFASVIGGSPAAAVVFPKEIRARMEKDERVLQVLQDYNHAQEVDKLKLRKKLIDTQNAVRLEKQGEVAKEFDAIHSVNRAVEVGSLDKIIEASNIRLQIIQSIEHFYLHN